MGFRFQGKKGAQAQGFGKSTKKARKSRRSFMLEEIITPSALIPAVQDTDPLRQFLGSLPLSDWNLGHLIGLVGRVWVHLLQDVGNSLHFMADAGGTCPTTPTPTGDLPPLIDFDPLGLRHDGIPTQVPGTPGGAWETLPPPFMMPLDPPGDGGVNKNQLIAIDPKLLDFPLANQPIVGSSDTGVSADNPYIANTNLKKGHDYVDGDDNPLLQPGEGSEHGTFTLGIIDSINKTAPKWVGRAIGSGKWADSLVDFVNAATLSGQKNAIINLSLDLTQKNPDGSVTTRYEFTPFERAALEYARQHGVMIVVAAGNNGDVMSVLGQSSQEFDNIITVGSGNINGRDSYSSYGRGLDIMADGGTTENPVLSTVGSGLGTMAGTSVATAKVTGAASLVWAANPDLSYRQVIEILEKTARDLGTPGWDDETGFGLLNTLAAVQLAKSTTPEVYDPTPWYAPDYWDLEGIVTPEERAVSYTDDINNEYRAWGWLLGNSTRPIVVAGNSPQGTSGFWQSYNTGTIHWTAKYGAVALWYDLQREYNDLGGSGGWLGFPTKREYDWNGKKRTDFEGGYIYWDGVRAKAYRPNELPPGVLPTAPTPGTGKVPVNAGAFNKTVVSNGVVNHYYANGYLTVQPSGQASWYGSGGSGVVSTSVKPLNTPVTITDPDGNYSILTSKVIFASADLNDGIDHKAVGGSIGGSLDREDYYRFTLDKISDVDIQLSGDNANAKFYLAKDVNGNGKIDYGEALQGANQGNNIKKISRSLGPGTYYVVVSSDDRVNQTKYNLNVDTKPETAGNSLLYAQDIGLLSGSKTFKGLVDTKVDTYDYYRFNLDETSNVNLKLDKLISEPFADINGISPFVSMELINMTTGTILQSAAGNSSSAASINRLLQPGSYYVRVNSSETNGYASYELTLDGKKDIPLNHWKASFINRNAGNVSQFNMDDFKNPVATLDLGSQGSGNGNLSLYRNWGLNSPDNRVQKDYFAMQASTRTNMQAGKLYQVRTKSDDGTRFSLKNVKTGEVKSIEQLGGWSDGDWRGRGADEPNKIIYFKVPESGDYDFYVQYYENEGGSTVDISMGEVKPVDSFFSVSDKTNWKSSVYWWDRTKAGDPPLDFQKAENKIGVYNLGQNDRSDGKKGISLDWRNGKLPNNDVTLPKNNFAISSYTQARFEQGKKYTAWVYSDDGYQLYAINRSTGQRVDITPSNEWKKDAYGKHQAIDINVPPGDYDVYFNYFDGGGDAYFDLSWEGVQQQNNNGGGSGNSGTIPDIIPAKSAIPGGIKDSSIKGSFVKDILDAVNGGVIRQDVGNFLMGIVATESGGNWQAGRGSYYLGAFQIGKDHIQKYAQLTGVDITSEQFLNNKDLQLKVAQWLYDENLKWINNLAINGFSGWTTEPDKQPLAQYFADKSTLYKSAYFWLDHRGGPDGNGVYSKDYARAADESAQLITQTLSGSSGNNSGGTTGIKIELSDPDGSFTQSQMLKIRQAAENWQRIIQKDKANGVLKIALTTVRGLYNPITGTGNVAQTTRDDGGPNNRTNIMGGNQDGSVTINGVRYDNKIEFDPDYISQNSNMTLVRLAMHEIGHTLGLKHEDSGDGDIDDPSLGPNGLMNHNYFPPNITPGIYDRLESLGYKVNRDPSIIKWS